MTKTQSYEILGVSRDADEKEIKKAYFKLVRQFSPEKDPEKFKEIREAYEYLSQEHMEKELLEGVTFESGAERKAAETICEALDQENWGLALAYAEDFSKIFDSEIFEYLLYIAQRQSGKTGKAVKTIEDLVESHPDNIGYKRELAFAYGERGYRKKANQVSKELYEGGLRDFDFMFQYMMSLGHDTLSESEKEMMYEIIDKSKENLEEYGMAGLVAITMLMHSSSTEEQMEKTQHIEYEYLKEIIPHLKEWNNEMITSTVGLVAMQFLTEGIAAPEELETITSLVKEQLDIDDEEESDPELAENLLFAVQANEFEKDEQISDLLKEMFEEYVNDSDDILIPLYQMDVKLRLLEEWDQHKEEVLYVKEKYPLVYEELEEGLKDLIESTDHDLLREKLLKKYNRLACNCEMTPYYHYYPERRKKEGTIQWDSEESGSYRRVGKKIGRNDPCPCGSGKKYKNCCGRGK